MGVLEGTRAPKETISANFFGSHAPHGSPLEASRFNVNLAAPYSTIETVDILHGLTRAHPQLPLGSTLPLRRAPSPTTLILASLLLPTPPPMSATMWDSKEQQRYHRPPPSPRIGNGHSYQQNGHGRALSSGGGNGGSSSSSSSLSNTNTSSTVAIPRRVSRLFWLLAVFTALVVLSPQFSTTSHRAVRKFRNTRVASTLRPYSRTQLSQYLSSYIPQPVWPRHMDGLPLHHHPILELIRDAQQTHSEKTARQSENVQEAEQEYRRRYEKAPPQDFDRWFTRAKGERWEV